MKDQNKEERVKNWHGYFKEMLGKPPKIINENENINNVLDENELDIKTTLSMKMSENKSKRTRQLALMALALKY